jgi:hypothetical protein
MPSIEWNQRVWGGPIPGLPKGKSGLLHGVARETQWFATSLPRIRKFLPAKLLLVGRSRGYEFSTGTTRAREVDDR